MIVLCFLININVAKAEDNIACSCLCDSVLAGAGCTNSEADCQTACDDLKDEFCPTGTMSNWVAACNGDQKCKSDGISAYCVDAKTGKVEAPPTTLEVPFGAETEAKNLGDYIRIVYDFGVILVAIVAVAMVVWGGFKWATSAGNSSQIASAKQNITGALIGLVLALTSWLLLMTINPALVDLKKLEIPPIPLSGYCGKSSGNCGVEFLENYVDLPGASIIISLIGAEGGFGDNAKKASVVCDISSGGDSNSVDNSIKCKDNNPFYIGLFHLDMFQYGSKINTESGETCYGFDIFNKNGPGLHGTCLLEQGGSDGCSKYDCEVKNQDLYNECVEQFKVSIYNIVLTDKISGAGSDWAWHPMYNKAKESCPEEF